MTLCYYEVIVRLCCGLDFSGTVLLPVAAVAVMTNEYKKLPFRNGVRNSKTAYWHCIAGAVMKCRMLIFRSHIHNSKNASCSIE
jgi:hypothetical protein